jgi:hypothetical protein
MATAKSPRCRIGVNLKSKDASQETHSQRKCMRPLVVAATQMSGCCLSKGVLVAATDTLFTHNSLEDHIESDLQPAHVHTADTCMS